jgi:tetratricopeptide (TPR) repeat protein
VEVRVRDGKHAGPDKYDAKVGTSFAINESQPVPLESANQSNLAEAWNSRGDYLMKQDKFDEAIEAYDEAIWIDPNYANAWNNKGNILYLQSKFDEAIKAYDESIRLDSNFFAPWCGKGQLLYDQGKFDEAIRLYPNFVVAWNNKGWALKALGRTSEAEAAFAVARTLEQGNQKKT